MRRATSPLRSVSPSRALVDALVLATSIAGTAGCVKTVAISSHPTGAAVFVDDTAVGTTPCEVVVDWRPADRAYVELRHPECHEFTTKMPMNMVSAGPVAKQHYVLARLPATRRIHWSEPATPAWMLSELDTGQALPARPDRYFSMGIHLDHYLADKDPGNGAVAFEWRRGTKAGTFALGPGNYDESTEVPSLESKQLNGTLRATYKVYVPSSKEAQEYFWEIGISAIKVELSYWLGDYNRYEPRITGGVGARYIWTAGAARPFAQLYANMHVGRRFVPSGEYAFADDLVLEPVIVQFGVTVLGVEF